MSPRGGIVGIVVICLPSLYSPSPGGMATTHFSTTPTSILCPRAMRTLEANRLFHGLQLTFCELATRAPEVPGDSPKGNKGVKLLCPLALWEQHGRGGLGRLQKGSWYPGSSSSIQGKCEISSSIFTLFKTTTFHPSAALHSKHIRLTLCCVNNFFPYENVCCPCTCPCPWISTKG